MPETAARGSGDAFVHILLKSEIFSCETCRSWPRGHDVLATPPHFVFGVGPPPRRMSHMMSHGMSHGMSHRMSHMMSHRMSHGMSHPMNHHSDHQKTHKFNN